MIYYFNTHAEFSFLVQGRITMPRELNFELFDSESKPRPSGSPSKQKSVISGGGEMATQMRDMQKRIRDLESAMTKTQSRVAELSRVGKLIGERSQAAVQRLDGMFRSGVQELKSSVSTLAGRVTERRAMEAKIQELIDRHNQVVQKYDTRLSQMQRLVSEQEMKLYNYKSTIEELQRKGK